MIEELRTKYKDYKPSRIDKKTWVSAHSLIKKVTKPFDREGISKRVAEKRGITQEEVLAEWDMEGKIALSKGNCLHNCIASNFEYKKSDEFTTQEQIEKMAEYAKRYIEDVEGTCIAREGFLTDPDKKLYGFLDYLIYSKKTNKTILLDWKTNKEIDKYNKFENFLSPLETLDASKANIYSLQLNFYKYIIEKVIDIKVDEMHIVWINDNNPTYEIIKAVDMQNLLLKVI